MITPRHREGPEFGSRAWHLHRFRIWGRGMQLVRQSRRLDVDAFFVVLYPCEQTEDSFDALYKDNPDAFFRFSHAFDRAKDRYEELRSNRTDENQIRFDESVDRLIQRIFSIVVSLADESTIAIPDFSEENRTVGVWISREQATEIFCVTAATLRVSRSKRKAAFADGTVIDDAGRYCRELGKGDWWYLHPDHEPLTTPS